MSKYFSYLRCNRALSSTVVMRSSSWFTFERKNALDTDFLGNGKENSNRYKINILPHTVMLKIQGFWHVLSCIELSFDDRTKKKKNWGRINMFWSILRAKTFDWIHSKIAFSEHDHISIFTAKFLCEPPVTLRSAYNCFNVSMPGAAMNITYGMNSVLLWSIFNAFGAQSNTHILPKISAKRIS